MHLSIWSEMLRFAKTIADNNIFYHFLINFWKECGNRTVNIDP